MSVTLRQQTTNRFEDCQLLQLGAQTCRYLVANAAVFVQTMAINPNGGEGEWEPVPDGVLTAPTTDGYDNVIGIRFRSAVASSPAVVVAQLYAPGDAIPLGGVPFTQSLDVAGKVSSAGQMITGIVNAAGVPQGGTGYNVNHTGTGVYVITFGTEFAATPVVLVSPLAAGVTPELSGPDASQVTVAFNNVPGGAAVDSGFHFVAVAVQ